MLGPGPGPPDGEADGGKGGKGMPGPPGAVVTTGGKVSWVFHVMIAGRREVVLVEVGRR